MHLRDSRFNLVFDGKPVNNFMQWNLLSFICYIICSSIKGADTSYETAALVQTGDNALLGLMVAVRIERMKFLLIDMGLKEKDKYRLNINKGQVFGFVMSGR